MAPYSSQDLFRPPLALVQTWCTLLKERDQKVKEHAIKMLLRTFGDMEKVAEFVKKNNIDIWKDKGGENLSLNCSKKNQIYLRNY